MIQNKQLITGFIALLLLASCVKEEIHNTSHPDHGKITLLTDWSKRGDGITIPQNYTVQIGEYIATLKGERNTIGKLFLPNRYNTLVFNIPEKITVKEGRVFVEISSGNYIEALPGWLFSYTADMRIEKDQNHTFTATMEQQVRELNLLIEPTGSTADKVGSVTATLSGVAQQLNLRDGVLSAEKNISLTFTKQQNGKYKATARLLGFASAAPKLTVKIAFTAALPAEITQDYDLSNQLKAFNGDKTKPFYLGAQLIETPTATGFIATITDWETVKEGNGTAD